MRRHQVLGAQGAYYLATGVAPFAYAFDRNDGDMLANFSQDGLPGRSARLADHAAIALENARLYEELAEHRRRLQDLVSKLVAAQEEERRRLRRDLGLTQSDMASDLEVSPSYIEESSCSTVPKSMASDWLVGLAPRLPWP